MMTPAVWGFVLDSDTLAEDTGDDMLAAALDALTRGFAIATEHGAAGSGGRHRTWLDTFDWRLHDAGLVLEYEQSRRGGRLLLTRTDDTPVAEQPATGWQPRRPGAAGCPAARPGPGQGGRAGQPPGAAAHCQGGRRRRRDAAAQARTARPWPGCSSTAPRSPPPPPARARTASAMMSGADVSLPPRLAVVPVRGYPGQARRAARLLVGTSPASMPADRSAFGEALAAIGRRPGDYSNKVRSEISGRDVNTVVAVATHLARAPRHAGNEHAGRAPRHRHRVPARPAGERAHTRSAIKLLGDVLPSDLAKWFGGIQMARRHDHAHQGPRRPPARLRPHGRARWWLLRPPIWSRSGAFLLRRRSRAFRALVRVLRSERFHAISDDWRKALLELRDGRGPRGPRRRLTAADLAVDRTGRSFRRLAAQGAAITASSPPESLHDLRKRGKELRYLLEFFAPLHDPAAYRKVVGDLKQLQDGLGVFQDSQVQREEIQALAAAQLLAERGGQQVCAATLLAMGWRSRPRSPSGRHRLVPTSDGGSRCSSGRKASADLTCCYPTCRRTLDEGLRHLQHQGRRRQDDRGREPGTSMRGRGLSQRCCGTSTRRARPASCSGSSPGSRAAAAG